jgi:hypothetical protein
MAENRSYESVKYTFTHDEIRTLGEQLAREAQTVFDLREQKATLTAELAGDIKSANKRVGDLTHKINHGYELREVEVMTMYENPRPGQKTIIRVDNNETLRVEPMSMKEMQSSFGFSAGEGEKE